MAPTRGRPQAGEDAGDGFCSGQPFFSTIAEIDM